ncbi:hypothetical protein [Butyrivibrio sp. NC3005]|uniref:hypothetical protein n=1 Tax=Butyrivibrio sp. NC3005 TaxID=1280685 RepID=UPI0004026D0E|nr:hypothetical protein [Butyrivibrio sp. NC3005]
MSEAMQEIDYKKRILFICNYYAPDSTIAAIRTTKIVKYLRQYGYEVDFLTVKNSSLSCDETLAREAESVKITYTQNSTTYVKLERLIKKALEPAKQKRMADLSNRNRVNPKTGHVEFYPFETAYPIVGSVEYIINIFKQKDLFHGIKNWIKKADSYDYMITSYGDAFCYYAGRYYHKIHPETKWIFDIRDSIYRYKFTPKYVCFIPKMIEKKVWKEADAIVGVSKGICGRVSSKYRDKVHLITNGYDLADRYEIKEEKLLSNKLVLTFTGSMYGGIQDLTPLFKALRELIDAGEIDINNIEAHFAGTASASKVFERQLSDYNLQTILRSHGKLDRYDTLKLQQKSDLLLCPAYDYENNREGMITGKFFEYMSAKRPILTIVTGDIKKSEIAEITRKCNIGVAYEQAHHESDYVGLKQFIMNAYLEKNEKGVVSYNPNGCEIKKYDYRNLTKHMIKVFNDISREGK